VTVRAVARAWLRVRCVPCRASHVGTKKPSPEARETGDGNLPPLLTQHQGSPRGDGTDGAQSRLTIRYRHGALRRSDRRAVSVVVTLSLLSSSVVTSPGEHEIIQPVSVGSVATTPAFRRPFDCRPALALRPVGRARAMASGAKGWRWPHDPHRSGLAARQWWSVATEHDAVSL
jgi:hypothetical protein